MYPWCLKDTNLDWEVDYLLLNQCIFPSLHNGKAGNFWIYPEILSKICLRLNLGC